ncbi:MAG: 2-amino-4-hydroxy-6-hydroxymethyldihydropteridine diphosphokinase [Lachnospiraceae bacterium]|nr:2-amino-4-hydroxy-6-hydroxymethyldihydropteridine diphosphokinase [Lachnospiraceae bacterium]
MNKELEYIKIVDLTVYANHGVLEQEKTLGQKFIISANIYADLKEACKTDDVYKTVNYAKICELITEVTKEKTYNLIETLADVISYRILKDYDLIDMIEVTVKKPFAPINLPVENVSVTVKRCRHIAYLSLGSNMGDREDYLDKAIDMLNKDDKCTVTKVAKYIETEPYGYVEQDKFMNTAIEVKTLYSPDELLKLSNDIEEKLDRVRTIKWGPRTVDVDIIFYDDVIINKENLIIPHKEMHLREFVLKPLLEIKPDYKHPLIRKNVYQIYEDLQNHIQKFNY